jgi:autotransporter-associated beta strand protein
MKNRYCSGLGARRGLMQLLLLLILQAAYAGSATWLLNAGDGNWNDASHWMPATVPNGPDDIATFNVSNTRIPSIFADTEVSSVVFNSGASRFTITVMPGLTFTISGAGIINNSGQAHNFITEVDDFLNGGDGGSISFTGPATAGAGNVFTVRGSEGNYAAQGGHIDFYSSSTAGSGSFINSGSAYAHGGVTWFHDSSTAGAGTFTNYGGVATSGGNGQTEFLDNSSAGNAIITNEGATALALGGFADFFGTSTAGSAIITNEGSSTAYTDGSWTTFWSSSSGGNATITCYGGAIGSKGLVDFTDDSTAANATIICHGEPADGEGGIAFFAQSSTGGTARIELFGKGTLSVTYRTVPKVTVGSIEGDGFVNIERNELTVGSNNLSTSFSGIINDAGLRGSLRKIGNGTFTLENANTYLGGTRVERGQLLVNNTGGSGTGSGPVQVNSGKLGGKGIIAGAVTVGTGGRNPAVLIPGNRGTGLLVIQNTLAFGSNGACQWQFDTRTLQATEAFAQSVTIDSSSTFSATARGTLQLPLGTVFTVISNTAVTPIAGTFANLPHGGTITVGSNTFQANYEGGDGNDLTLTVVP